MPPPARQLPWPTEWPEHRDDKRLFSVIMCVLFALGALAVGVGFVPIGVPGGVKYGVLFAALFLLGAVLGYSIRVRQPRGYGDVRQVQRGTEVRHSLAVFVCLVVLVCCMATIFVVAAVDYAFSGMTVAAAAFGALGLAAMAFVLLVALGRIRRGWLRLSADGIQQRGWTFSSFLPWDAFAGTKASYNGKRLILVIAYPDAPWHTQQIVRSWKIDRLPPVPMIEIDCLQFAVPPETLYWWVKYYVEHPEARVELGTDAAIARLRSGIVT